MNVPRSINLADDLNRKGVVEGYRPTRKSLEVVRAVCGTGGSRATHVVAPYGAGKSIAALAGLTLLSGPSRRAACLRGRISSVDDELSGTADAAHGNSLVVLLHGAHPDLAAELCRQTGVRRRSRMDDALKAILAKAKRDGIQHIAVVWDEFGQHLETLVREGRPEDLLAVQDLAEWAVRRRTPVVTFTTLMHKGVRNYARRVADDARTAWQKIEGRFDTLNLIDDGVDVYEMIADTLDGARDADCRDLARRARDIGFFPAFNDDESLSHVLARTAPLTPAALDVLPRLASLVAQNERTMFRCLEETTTRAGPGGAVGLDALYDYFSPSMRADTGAGGTHRRLVEAETALSRAETDLQRMIVKSATLLQLGRATERTRLPQGRLLFAVTEGAGAAHDDARAAVAALVERKVLLHRRRVDDMSVWHGADIDLTGMVAEEAARVSAEMDIVSTLERAFPPDAYSSPRYNHEWSITRFARARFALTRDILDPGRRERLCAEADAEDALVALVLDGAPAGRDLAEAVRTMPRHFIAAVPHRPTEVGMILADLIATEELLERPELLETDPLVGRELDELRAEADSALRRELDRVMNLDRGEVGWKSGGGGIPTPQPA